MLWLASRSRLLVWATLGIVAALFLGLFAWFDLADFGQSWSDADPHPYATADRVAYGLGVWRSYYQGDVLTANPTYPLLWGWAGLNTALLWPLRRRFAAGRVMFWGYALTLAGLLLAGVTLLPHAAAEHNAVLAAYPQSGARTVSAFGPLEVRVCTDPQAGCQVWDTSRVFNPAVPGLLALVLTPALGLLVGAWEVWKQRKEEAGHGAAAIAR